MRMLPCHSFASVLLSLIVGSLSMARISVNTYYTSPNIWDIWDITAGPDVEMWFTNCLEVKASGAGINRNGFLGLTIQ